MIGLDTTVLIAFEIKEHPLNHRVKEGIHQHVRSDGILAIAPQVFDEFLHVVTDAKRFARPLNMSDALARIAFWRQAKEVKMIFPTEKSLEQQQQWMREFGLGRKRILDTSLAATYKESGIRNIATANPKDFALFNVFAFETWAF
jgi:predicted nucleic acid-binding protein